jgi:hypothetical protein
MWFVSFPLFPFRKLEKFGFGFRFLRALRLLRFGARGSLLHDTKQSALFFLFFFL